MDANDINLNPVYLYFMIAVTEEFIFRFIPFQVFMLLPINHTSVIALISLALVSATLYSLAHKLAFSWIMVGITFILGLWFMVVWVLLPVLPAFLLTVALHYSVILINARWHLVN